MIGAEANIKASENSGSHQLSGNSGSTSIPYKQSVRGGLRIVDETDASISADEAKSFLREISEALDAARNGSIPYSSSIAWPAGLSRSTAFGLDAITRVQTRIVHSCFIVQGSGSLTVEDLLRMPNFDHERLLQLLLAVEEFLKQKIGIADDLQAGVGREEARQFLTERANFDEVLRALSTPWEEVGRALAPALAASAELKGTTRLSDVLSPEIVRLASRMGIQIGATDMSTLMDDAVGPISASARRVEGVLQRMSARQRLVVERRLVRSSRKTLEEVGGEIGVTRERVRQIQKNVERRLHNAFGTDLQLAASLLKEEQGPVVPKGDLDRRINEVLAGLSALVGGLIRNSLIRKMDYELIHGYYLDNQAADVVWSLRHLADKSADDVGIVDKETLIAGLPSNYWRQFWPAFQHCCQFHELSGFLSIRDTTRARTKAAILSIGRPATKQEIGRISGLEESRIGASLSTIESVVRADKHRWGLREWIDDEYEGIVAEIVQRINEDGGATTAERLLTELPEKFGVTENSVHTYIQTPKFVVRDGLVSLAHVSELKLRDFDDVISGRDIDGDPYWTFVVEARFFSGYSVTGVPPEFVKALGCKPDQRTSVRVANLPDWWELSLSWPLASATGASVGYLARPLGQLGAKPGQKVRIVNKGEGAVNLVLDEETNDRTAAGEADAIVQRMIERRRGL